MNRAILSLAANTPDKQEQMRLAIEELRAISSTLLASTVYETEPVGNKNQPRYLNAVAVIEIEMEYEVLHSRLKELERLHGRTPESKTQGTIPLDIDIVMWNSEILRPRDWEQDYFTIGLNQLQQP